MTAIAGAAVSFRTLVDGSARVTVDFEPQDAAAAFAMLGKPGQPIAVAALRDGFAAVPDKPKVGPLCLEAVRYCEMPEFWEWVTSDSGHHVYDAAGAKVVILFVCGVKSRKELDLDQLAANEFTHKIRTPFMKYMRERKA